MGHVYFPFEMVPFQVTFVHFRGGGNLNEPTGCQVSSCKCTVEWLEKHHLDLRLFDAWNRIQNIFPSKIEWDRIPTDPYISKLRSNVF